MGFTGPASDVFKLRLKEDMTALTSSVDVICMQEVNDNWARYACEHIPPSWSWHHVGTLCVFHSGQVESKDSEYASVFPAGSGVAKESRQYQEVARRRALSPVQRLSSCVRHVVVVPAVLLLVAVGHDVFAMCAKHGKTHGKRIATCMAITTTWRTRGTGMATTWQTHGKYMANVPCVCHVFALYSACQLKQPFV
jgi:hypothetical protein